VRSGRSSWDVDALCVPRARWLVSTKLDLYKPIVTALLVDPVVSSRCRLATKPK